MFNGKIFNLYKVTTIYIIFEFMHIEYEFLLHYINITNRHQKTETHKG